jgi:hypothetical protein
MLYKRILLLLLVLLPISRTIAQTSISLTPTTYSPSSYTLQTTTAGATPSNPLTNYTSQSVRYSWPFLGDNIYGTIEVNSTTVPSGMTITVQAANPGSWAGSSGGLVTVGSTYNDIINSIWYANRKTVTLTQNVFISDFSQLHPGTYVVTMNYRIY